MSHDPSAFRANTTAAACPLPNGQVLDPTAVEQVDQLCAAPRARCRIEDTSNRFTSSGYLRRLPYLLERLSSTVTKPFAVRGHCGLPKVPNLGKQFLVYHLRSFAGLGSLRYPLLPTNGNHHDTQFPPRNRTDNQWLHGRRLR